jgi:hypothetical protein
MRDGGAKKRPNLACQLPERTTSLNVANNEHDISDEAIHWAKKNQGI